MNLTAPLIDPAAHPPTIVGDVASAGSQTVSQGTDPADAGWIASMVHALSPIQNGSLSVTHLLATGCAAWRMAVFAAIAAGLTRWYGGPSGLFTSVRLVTFTNVRLIRCSLDPRGVRMATAHAAHPFATRAPSGGGSSPTTRTRPRDALRGVLGIVRLLQRPLHDFSATPPGVSLGGDGTLMLRIGELLAATYAGFLAIWFWATRVRWNGRS